jgi:hypothetical protein
VKNVSKEICFILFCFGIKLEMEIEKVIIQTLTETTAMGPSFSEPPVFEALSSFDKVDSPLPPLPPLLLLVDIDARSALNIRFALLGASVGGGISCETDSNRMFAGGRGCERSSSLNLDFYNQSIFELCNAFHYISESYEELYEIIPFSFPFLFSVRI